MQRIWLNSGLSMFDVALSLRSSSILGQNCVTDRPRLIPVSDHWQPKSSKCISAFRMLFLNIGNDRSSLPIAYHCAPCPVKTKQSLGFAVARNGLDSLDLMSCCCSSEFATTKDLQGRELLRSLNVNARLSMYALASFDRRQR